MTFEECLWGWFYWEDVVWLSLWAIALWALWRFRAILPGWLALALVVAVIIIALLGEYVSWEMYYNLVCYERMETSGTL
ncbi:hypothetical protein ROA7450_04075 [Roseovarius albus]|uniref:Uncharacterized protein n=1 Tax=Roseovarius albus TaxID=1247867 RepID=A0A1X7A878_9RHOB|nr:hypothetical protein [Roseovarius albus]SLN72894.1 hypothetical protein ROA7450_04075 [Roseovarius albus]